LSTRTGRLCAVSTSGSELDVQGSDTELLASSGNILGSQHSSVRRRLITISLDLHSTGDADEGLTTGKIGDVNEGVIERGKDVGNTENLLTWGDLGLVGEVFLLLFSLLLWSLHRVESSEYRTHTVSILLMIESINQF
jgi:hypothetical protein